MSMPVTISVVQFAPLHKNIQANVAQMCEYIATATTDLVVFPELAISGYSFASTDEAHPYALTRNSKAINILAASAKAAQRAVIFGYIEQDGEILYNSAMLIDQAGRQCLHYRKVHLFYMEKKVFAAGNLGFPVAPINCNGQEVTVGIQICYDWRFPEATRSLALQGAEIIAIPSNIVTTTGMLDVTLRTRAFENKVILAFADRVGSEILTTDPEEKLQFRGESMVINYNGEVLARLSSQETLIASVSVEPEKTRNKDINYLNNILSDRNKNQYLI